MTTYFKQKAEKRFFGNKNCYNIEKYFFEMFI